MSTQKFTSHRLSKKSAALIAGVLQDIEAINGSITPEAVLKAAEAKQSPLHRFFLWDDSEAARQYRLVQAAWLIRTVQARVVVKNGEATTRAFVRVVAAAERKGSYVNIKSALKDEGWRAQLLAQAVRELESFTQKYAVLSELSVVFQAIARVTKKHRKAA